MRALGQIYKLEIYSVRYSGALYSGADETREGERDAYRDRPPAYI